MLAKPTPPTVRIDTIPAPVGGLNARDGIANMPPIDAVELENWVPDTYGVVCRGGFREWAIDFPSGNAVQSILPYFAADDTFPGGSFLTDPTTMPGALFAATKAGIYDITSPTNTPAASIALAGSDYSGWFSHTMLTNSAGSFLLACSESDGYFTFDGTTWLKRVAGAGAGQVNGVDPANLVHVSTWKRRAWFVERNSTRAWYLAADAIAGTITSFDFGPLFKRGGHLAYTANWTIDAGEGIDDFFVVVGSNGDVLVYKGTDPASAATFGLVGSWSVGQIPIGRRGYAQYGGDLVIISTDGISPISMITRGGSQLLQASSKDYSSKIGPLIGRSMRESFTQRGWQILLDYLNRILLVSSPDYGSSIDTQYAMSTSVNEWCLFTGIPTLCYGSIAGYVFAGTGDGKVLLLFVDEEDEIVYGEESGEPIVGTIIPAYNYFKTPYSTKQFTMVRPSFLSSVAPGLSVGVSVDFNSIVPTSVPSFTTPIGSLWDTALWDTAAWSGGVKSYSRWLTAGNVGKAGTISLRTATVKGTVLTSVDYMYRVGGPFN